MVEEAPVSASPAGRHAEAWLGVSSPVLLRTGRGGPGRWERSGGRFGLLARLGSVEPEHCSIARSDRVRLPMLIPYPSTNPFVINSRERRRFALALLVSAASLGAPAVLRAQVASARSDALRQSKSVSEAMALAGVVSPEPARRVLLDAPDILIAGDSAEIRVVSRMPGTDWIMLLAEGRSSPVIDVVEFTPGEDRALSAKVVLSRTTRLRAIARSAGRYYSVTREIKVAGAGCPR